MLQSGRRIPNLTTLFRLDMYVAYVKNNPEPAPRRIKARIFRKKIRSKQKCEFVWYHRLQLGTLNNDSKIPSLLILTKAVAVFQSVIK